MTSYSAQSRATAAKRETVEERERLEANYFSILPALQSPSATVTAYWAVAWLFCTSGFAWRATLSRIYSRAASVSLQESLCDPSYGRKATCLSSCSSVTLGICSSLGAWRLCPSASTPSLTTSCRQLFHQKDSTQEHPSLFCFIQRSVG